MPRLHILELQRKKTFKKGFVIRVKGYHGDMDYKVNESYHCKVDCQEDEEWLAMAYLGYQSIKANRNKGNSSKVIEKVYEDMGGREAVIRYGFDWPINPWDSNGDFLMTVESCSIEYHDGHGNINQVEVVR